MVFPLHFARAEGDYVAAVEASIGGGGCTSSRASLAGACYGALATDRGIPAEWVGLVAAGGRIEGLVGQLPKLRDAVRAQGSKI